MSLNMRFSTLVAVCLLPICGAFAAEPPPSPPAPAAATSDAATRHAKRAACLKEAKAKKLVGAEKTSFLKSCIAAP
jgi:hypothetical protein